MDTVRLDKFLWAARFYKTRSDAAKACDMGRITSNGHLAKPARDVRVNDTLHIRNEGGEFTVTVLALSATRGPAAVAQTLYSESAASREARARAAEERKAAAALDIFPAGKPSKKDRRNINKFRGRVIGF